MILLDTCAAVWIADGAADIPPGVRLAVADASRNARLALSAITAWEIATLSRRGRLHVVGSVDDYVRRLFALPGVREVPIDRKIATASGTLERFHGDPADRIIVATALTLDATICTRDRRIIRYASDEETSLDVLVC